MQYANNYFNISQMASAKPNAPVSDQLVVRQQSLRDIERTVFKRTARRRFTQQAHYVTHNA